MLETIYPLLQGYDSVAIRADVEIGGTDQKFNLLMGRKVQKRYGLVQQNVMTLWLIEGTDGVRKMSKSYGNYISLRDPPSEVYGKVMSLPDSLLLKYFRALSSCPIEEIEEWARLEKNERVNFPARDLKMKLAKEMVGLISGPRAAKAAEEEFIARFQKREKPSVIPEKKLPKRSYGICELLFDAGLAKSKSDARRLVEGGGVKVNDEKVLDPKRILNLSTGPLLIQAGKRNFLRVK
jgi:tyrosyl-tRNA synthetase